jgi:3-oxoacid CoA-transferase subunit B
VRPAAAALYLPADGAGLCRTVVTDLALIDIEADGFVVREIAPGVSTDDLRRLTVGRLQIAPECCEMV